MTEMEDRSLDEGRLEVDDSAGKLQVANHLVVCKLPRECPHQDCMNPLDLLYHSVSLIKSLSKDVLRIVQDSWASRRTLGDELDLM